MIKDRDKYEEVAYKCLVECGVLPACSCCTHFVYEDNYCRRFDGVKRECKICTLFYPRDCKILDKETKILVEELC
jgi:hypothetical protein